MPGTYRALLVLGWGLPALLGAGKDLSGLCFPPPAGTPFRDAALQGQLLSETPELAIGGEEAAWCLLIWN